MLVVMVMTIYTCHRAPLCGKVPVQSEYNHLQLDAMPARTETHRTEIPIYADM